MNPASGTNRRSRVHWGIGCALVIGLGLASRTHGAPAFVLSYAGDALYAVLVYGLVAVVAPPPASIGSRAVEGGRGVPTGRAPRGTDAP